MKLLESIFKEANNPTIISDFLKGLKFNSVKYAIFGGVAVSVYTSGLRAMSPEDIDIVIDDSPDVIDIIRSICTEVGARIESEHFFEGNLWFNIVKDTQEIDLCLNTTNKYLTKGLERAEQFEWKGLMVDVLHVIPLVFLKMEAGREKDMIDIALLLKSNKNALNYFQKYLDSSRSAWIEIRDYLDYDIKTLISLSLKIRN